MNDQKQNTELWDAVKQPPPDALKTIKGGRLQGMSDIKPQWRYRIMTEQFGPCGVGWKYTIDRLWLEDGSENQKIAFALILLFTRDINDPKSTEGFSGGWNDPIPGIGGSMFIAKEKNGLHTSDECFKMAVTDALGVAMQRLGVAADIYMGMWDGTKYKNGDNGKSPVGSKKPERRHYNDQPKLRAQIAAKIMDMCPETDKAAKAAHAKNKLKKMAAEYIAIEGTEGQQAAWGALVIDSMNSIPDAMIEGFYRFIAEEKYEPEALPAEDEPGESEEKNRSQHVAFAIAELNQQTTTKGIQSIVTKYSQFKDDDRFLKAIQQVEANIRATSETAQEQLP